MVGAASQNITFASDNIDVRSHLSKSVPTEEEPGEGDSILRKKTSTDLYNSNFLCGRGDPCSGHLMDYF